MVTVLLVPGGTSPLPEVVWWAVLLGVVIACVLATPVALRLWESGMEGLRGSGSADRDRGLRGLVSTPPAEVAVVGPEEKHAERHLLEAIDRHGEITPVRAALETPLTVARRTGCSPTWPRAGAWRCGSKGASCSTVCNPARAYCT
jgi:hypothetical protein